MYYLKLAKDGKIVLNRAGEKLLRRYYPPPRQHGKARRGAPLNDDGLRP